MALIVLLTGCSRYNAPPLSKDPKNLFAAAKPGTVIVLADFKARITVPASRVNEQKMTDKLVSMMRSGELDPNDDAAGIAAVVELVASDPLTYLEPDTTVPQRTADAEVQASGSGFIADPKGYVVTNAHVAAPNEEELKKELAAGGLAELAQQDAQDLAQGSDFPASVQKRLLAAFTLWNAKNLTIDSLEKSHSVVEGANVAGVETGLKATQAQLVNAGEEAPGKDVAIIKIDKANLPTLRLGDDAALGTGDKLYVVGYPADATFHPALSLESIAEPSFTGGQVSAKKRGAKGFEVIQTDAKAGPGNSGSPVLDKNGEVVGIMTFGTVDPTTGKQVEGYNFIMPTSVIKEFLDRAGAHPGGGAFNQLYTEGLKEESGAHHKHALAAFERINGLAPGHPYVQQRISYNQEAITAGKDLSLDPVTTLGIPAVVVVAAGLAGIGMLAYVRRKRRAPALAGSTAAVPVAYRTPDAAPSPPTQAPPMPTAPAGGTQTRVTGQDTHPPEDRLDELRRLAELRDAGVITDEDFQAKKAQLLDSIR